MKKSDRVGALIKILSDHPNQVFPLSYFCQLFGAAKSSVSEDITQARRILEEWSLGRIATSPGATGGVRFLPTISDEDTKAFQETFCTKLMEPDRVLGGGFLYTADLMLDGVLMRQASQVFCRLFSDLEADFVATIETKGIPAAFQTAQLLNIPCVVVRRESKISEGSTVSINYFSGSHERIQKMSVSKRAVKQGSRAIIIDDFMRAGGSVKGIRDMLKEFDITVVGTGIVIATTTPEKKKNDDFVPLIWLGEVDEEHKVTQAFPNRNIYAVPPVPGMTGTVALDD